MIPDQCTKKEHNLGAATYRGVHLVSVDALLDLLEANGVGWQRAGK